NARRAVGSYKRWGAEVTFEPWEGLGHRPDDRSEGLRQWLVTCASGRRARDGLEAKARSAEQAKDRATAIRLYEQYLAKWPGADGAERVRARLAALRSVGITTRPVTTAPDAADPDEQCRRWLTMARNYVNAGMKERARGYLKRILTAHPDTPWAAKAKAMLTRMNREGR
ncbi:hypothetical protein LCGC14_2089310, partial [marine sediment metagenome]